MGSGNPAGLLYGTKRGMMKAGGQRKGENDLFFLRILLSPGPPVVVGVVDDDGGRGHGLLQPGELRKEVRALLRRRGTEPKNLN